MFPSLSALIAVVICILRVCLAFEIDLPVPLPLPTGILPLIPECALDCIENFVINNLSQSCDDLSNLSCLCEALSADGYTLGEGSLYCLKAQCPDLYDEYNGLYGVCGSVSDAQTPTRTVLSSPPPPTDALKGSTHSATIIPAVSTQQRFFPSLSSETTLKAVSIAVMSTLQTSTRTTSLYTASRTSPASSAAATSTNSVASSTESADDSIASVAPSIAMLPSEIPSGTALAALATSSAAGPVSVLGKGQIAGIAVAGTVAAVAAIGLLFFVFCGKRLRRRTKRRDSDVSFGGSHIIKSDPEAGSEGETMSEVPKPITPLITPYNHGPKQNQVLGLPVAPNQHRQSWWNRRNAINNNTNNNLKPGTPLQTPSQIGVARHLTPNAGGISQETSPGSDVSYRTTSRLLPEKPSFPPGGRNIHEKKASNDTSVSQPTKMGSGPGLRIIAPTPEPFDQPHSNGYHLYAHPVRTDSNRALRKEPSMEGSALKGKLSDPFLDRSHDQADHARNAMLAPTRKSRSSLPRLSTAPARDSRPAPQSVHYSQTKGVPNFRHLVNPQKLTRTTPPQRSSPPQLPNVAPFSPISSDIATNVTLQDSYTLRTATTNSQSIMNRGRPTPNPFFSSHPSQSSAYHPYRHRSKRLRPETHYTTGSETSFEDEDPSPLSPPEPPPQLNIAELPGLSPVAESPVSKGARTNTATRTPSPRVQLTPPSNEQRRTPLSRVRYPDIPGTGESPKRKVETVPLVIGLPREGKVQHISELHKSSISPISQSQSPHTRNPSTGSTAISPNYESPTRLRAGSSPRLMGSPQQKPELIPSPLRPIRPGDNSRTQEDDSLPPPPPPKDDVPGAYPSPSTTAFSASVFNQAARRLGSVEASAQALGNWPLQPTRPIELPARNSGLGNWPVQPTRFSQQMVPPQHQGHRENRPRNVTRVAEPRLPTPDATYVSSTLRAVTQEPVGRSMIPVPSDRMIQGPSPQNARHNASSRRIVPHGRPSEERSRPSVHSRDYVPPPDPRREMIRLRELERRREFERQYERQQLDTSKQLSDYDVSLGTAPLLPPKGSFNRVQARRDLLGSGYDLQNPRGF